MLYTAAPKNAPQEVRVKIIDHDSVEVQWRGVMTGLDEEPLQGYMVSTRVQRAQRGKLYTLSCCGTSLHS